MAQREGMKITVEIYACGDGRPSRASTTWPRSVIGVYRSAKGPDRPRGPRGRWRQIYLRVLAVRHYGFMGKVQ